MHHIQFFPYPGIPLCVCETGPEEHKSAKHVSIISVADPGSLSRIPDPTFFHPGSRIRIFSIRDPGSASKNWSILPQKNGFLALGNKIRVVHPSHSGSRTPDPGGQKGTGSRIAEPDPQHWYNELGGSGGEVKVQPVLKICQTNFAKNPQNTKECAGDFWCVSRCQSITAEYMWNLQNDYYYSGWTHPGIDKIKQCVRVRPLLTR